MSRVVTVIAWTALAFLACDPTAGRSVREDSIPGADGAAPDSGTDSMVSQACSTAGATRCEGDALLTCTDGAWASSTCAAGCEASSPARCRAFVPTGVVETGDTSLAGLLPITIASDVVLDGTTGAIAGVRAPGVGVVSGVGFRIANKLGAGGVSYAVGVFSFASLTIASGGVLRLRGINAIALVAPGVIRIDGVIDARGECAGTAAGPGGFAGGVSNQPGVGPGAGRLASGAGTTDPGGGGGAYGAAGGRGGPTAEGTFSGGGVTYGLPEIVDLIGGSGGADGFNGGAAGGGGGGGAVQLFSLREIRVGEGAATGGIDAGGCGGIPSAGSGGGGGSGGAILIEAPVVTVATNGALAANGGAGGASESTGSTREHGKLGATPAPGGAGAGAGGAGASPAGKDGSKPGGAAGGGGGGCGRIRINSVEPADLRGIISPAIGSGATARNKAGG